MSSQLRTLLNGERVAIVGGGPAGSFFAIHLLRETKRLNRHLDVVIVEKRGPADLGADVFQCRGCTFCAGVISPRLNETLKEHDLVVPDEIIQGRIDYVWIQGQWKNFRLRVPKHMQMYSVFRGSLPGRRSGRVAGFDAFLLGEAVKAGARILVWQRSGHGLYRVWDAEPDAEHTIRRESLARCQLRRHRHRNQRDTVGSIIVAMP